MFSENVKGRGPGRPRGATPQGEETRRLLYETAVAMFSRDGYEATTLRGIARAAGVSPGLLYRYFPSKRAVVLELYDELSLALEARAGSIRPGKWRTRFIQTLKASLDVLGPHRESLSALVPLIVGTSDEGLFSPSTAFSRERVLGVFQAAVAGSTDAPRGPFAASLGRVLYLAHLGVLLWWLLDRSRGQRTTGALVRLLERMLAPLSLALRLRPMRALVRRLDDLVGEGLFGPA